MKNEKMKDISIKLILTIPALIIGVFGGILYILKPVIDLWGKKVW